MSNAAPSKHRVQRTQPTRLARLLDAETQIGYQKALQEVTSASEAGRLPERLDHAGLDLALRLLMQQDYAMWSPLAAGHPWPDVYQPLMHALPGARTKQALEAAERAHCAGVREAVEDGTIAPDEVLSAWKDDEGDEDDAGDLDGDEAEVGEDDGEDGPDLEEELELGIIPGLPLAERITHLTELTVEPAGASHHDLVARASGVLNYAALIASDVGMPDLAAQLCGGSTKSSPPEASQGTSP